MSAIDSLLDFIIHPSISIMLKLRALDFQKLILYGSQLAILEIQIKSKLLTIEVMQVAIKVGLFISIW